MREAKQHAREAHSKSLFTSVNLRPLERWGYRLSQHLDAAYYEFKGAEPTGDPYPQALRPGFPPKTSSVAISKLFAALGLRIILQNQIAEMTTGEIEPSGNLVKPTLKRIIQAEVTAAGGNYKCHNGTWSPTLDGIYEDPDVTGRDYDWIRSHAALLDDYEPIPGDYAIVVSLPMCRYEIDAMQTRYWGAAHLLLRTHRHFDVLAWGDGRDYPDTISPEILLQYKAVVLPNLRIMTEAMIEKLLQYVRKGGCLILLEESALLDQDLKPMEHTIWQGATSKTQGCDEGQIVLIDSDFGVFRYKGAEDRGVWTLEDPDLGTHYFLTLDERDLTSFAETISKHVQEDFETDLHRDVVLAAQNIRTYRNGTWRQVLHLVNNDYAFESDRVTPHKGTITFRLPRWNGKDEISIAHYRFTSDEHETLDYTTLADGRIRVEVPAIGIWSIVAITTSDR
jgi:hypothetical protein